MDDDPLWPAIRQVCGTENMRRVKRRRRRRHTGGALFGALSALAPVGKGAAMGLAKAVGKRAVKKGVRTARGVTLGALGTGIGYGV